ncbi:unnamed protein product [Ceutorhynchus assimilis]|uniref:SH3 domain-binding glutamic acid-rich protein n=1 Tax=Ceutorhynchus assimilis TaxID=467358 RepID=A0A9N9MPU1_9CUCU|nr:unnamed protein product [Ceutorhynchus assimilis]
MVVKVYVSGSSGNKEVKKRQQRVSLILDSKNIEYELLDIAEPNMEEAKEYMQTNSKLMGGTISDPNPRHPLPPQLFNGEEYCGDYDAFDMANEVDEMEKFLKLSVTSNGDISTEVKSKEASPEKDEAKAEETEKEETDEGEKKTKEKSPTPSKEKSPSPAKEKSPSPAKEKSPAPEKQKSPEPEKESSPSPQKEKSPSPAKEDGEGDNATDDQKAENENNDNATDDQKAVTDDVKQTDETEKSDDEA